MNILSVSHSIQFEIMIKCLRNRRRYITLKKKVIFSDENYITTLNITTSMMKNVLTVEEKKELEGIEILLPLSALQYFTEIAVKEAILNVAKFKSSALSSVASSSPPPTATLEQRLPKNPLPLPPPSSSVIQNVSTTTAE